MNENLKSRLTNFKFESAKMYLDGESEDTRDIVNALAETFGNYGWFNGHMGTIVGTLVSYLTGEEDGIT